MKQRRPAAISVGTVVAALLLTGCSASQQERDLTAIESQLELNDLGSVICEYWRHPTVFGGETHFRFIGVVGSDNYEPIIDRFLHLGFELEEHGVRPDGTRMFGEDGEDLTIQQYTNPATVDQNQPSDCEIPPEGLVTIAMYKV